MKSPSTLHLITNPAVAPLFLARLISSAGVGFGQLALVWGVKGLGYGPSAISLVLACKAVPALLILAGGIAGDRFKRHHVLVSAEALASVTWLALGACFLTGNAPLLLLCALATLSGVATAMFLPTIRGVIADLVEPEHRQTGNALISQTDAVGLLVGLASSGLVVTLVGPGWAAGTKGALCAISALLMTQLTTSRPQNAPNAILTDLRTGWRHFTRHRWVWMMTLQFTAVIIAAATFTEIIGPLHMSGQGRGAEAWGIIAACEASGALAGAIIGVRWRPRRPITMTAALPASAAIPMVLMACGAPWPVIAAGMLIPGVCQSVYYILWTTQLQRMYPLETLARVNSWGIVGSFSLTPIALLMAGPMIDATGTQLAALSIGLLVAAATSVTLLALTVTNAVKRASDLKPGLSA